MNDSERSFQRDGEDSKQCAVTSDLGSFRAGVWQRWGNRAPRNLCWLQVLLVAAFVCALWSEFDGLAGEMAGRWRRPLALQLTADNRWLYVANSRSGTLTVIDCASGVVSREVAIGGRLSAIRLCLNDRGLLIADEANHELLLCSIGDGKVEARQRLAVSRYPVDIAVTANGHQAFVSSLWSHRVTAVDVTTAEGGSLQISAQLDLLCAAVCQLLADRDSRLIVADAFGGRLAIVDSRSLQLQHIRTFPSHNIRGLGLSPDGKMLLVAHQMLNELAHTTNNDVHWGLLMSNDLRWLPLSSILSPTADLYTGAHMHPLGHAGNATGDPSGLAVTSAGVVLVTLGGIDEMAVGSEDDFSLQRIEVGRRPTAVTVTSDGQWAYVANTLADSISVVDLKKRESNREIPLGPPGDLTLVDRGELLFYDARLSHDGWMSCHSCHTDGHSNGLLNDNFSDESFGASKRVLSLAGQTDTAPFAWNAGAPDLPTQIRTSITQTMQGDQVPSDGQVAALAEFVKSLPLPPPLSVARGELPNASTARGRQLFASLKCDDCHAPPTYTSPRTFDVGLHDKQGNKLFNPPSLRSVSQRGPLFHDNRAPALEAVFSEVGHQLSRELSADELRDLISFLNSL